jgi:hypothetical protein
MAPDTPPATKPSLGACVVRCKNHFKGGGARESSHAPGTHQVTNMTRGVGTKLTTAMPSKNCCVVMNLLINTKERSTYLCTTRRGPGERRQSGQTIAC